MKTAALSAVVAPVMSRAATVVDGAVSRTFSKRGSSLTTQESVQGPGASPSKMAEPEVKSVAAEPSIDIIRAKIEASIAASGRGRESSNFEEHVQREATARAVINQPASTSPNNPLRSGQLHEAEQLFKLGIDKNTEVFRSSEAQMKSAAFKVIVGTPKFTKGGQAKGTIFDGAPPTGHLEIKGGLSELTLTYQLRLQTYKSLIDNKLFTIQTTRPVNPEFKKWLDSWGVNVVKP